MPELLLTLSPHCIASSNTEHEHLREEIIAADGVTEEYFAFDST